MKNTFAFLFLTAAVVLPSVHALATTERTANQTVEAQPVAGPELPYGFSYSQRQAIYDSLDLPPFQREIREEIRAKNHLPGAIVNSVLSPSVIRSDIPPRFLRKLNPPRAGTKYVAVVTDLVLLDLRTMRVLDVVPNVIPQYTR